MEKAQQKLDFFDGLKAPLAGAFSLWNPVHDGTRRERPAQWAGKKVSGGHFFSSGESPMAFGTQSVGLWNESHFFTERIDSP